jgi:hypothetical protein
LQIEATWAVIVTAPTKLIPYSRYWSVHVLRKGKCFPYNKERKTLSWHEGFFFFPLTGIQFPLTNFPHVDQTWESGENGFQKNEFLETNRALVKRERECK